MSELTNLGRPNLPAPQGQMGTGAVDPIISLFAKAQVLLRIAGTQGANNLTARLIDLYLTNSSLTSREAYHSNETAVIFDMLPAALQSQVENLFTWVDRALALNFISEAELEGYLYDPSALTPLLKRLVPSEPDLKDG